MTKPVTSSDSVAKSASVLMAGQAAIKLMTFTLNQLLMRYVTPEALGLSQMLEFVINYVLFLCRESVRLSVPKIQSDNPSRAQLVANMAIVLPSALFLLVGIPLSQYQLRTNTDLNQVTYSPQLILVVAFAIVIELVSEPYYDINQYIQLNFAKRAKIEGLASFIRCLVQFATVIAASKSLTSNYVWGFAAGQLAYASALLVLYTYNSSKLLPKAANETWFDHTALSYFKSVFFQQIFKHFLTEGDKFLVGYLLDIRIQGYYAIISNYGSLFARLIFQPVEESVRINVTALFEDSKLVLAKKKTRLNESLSIIVKLYTYLLVLVLLFAPSSTKFLVNTVFASFDAKDQLVSCFKLYWYYLPALAINGVTEALFNSLFNNSTDVNQYSKLMLGNSLLFFANVYVFLQYYHLQLRGLILGNLINMAIRIIYCSQKLQNYVDVQSFHLSRYATFLSEALAVWLAQQLLFHGEASNFKEFLENALLGIFMVVAAALNEQDTLKPIVTKTLGKFTAKQHKS